MSDPSVVWWSDEVLDRSRWGELVEPALNRLVGARDRDRLPHATLLVGPPGLGRELAAVEAAVLMVCEGAREPWGESSCATRVRRGLHPDVVAVLPGGPRGSIKIKSVRTRVVEVVAGRPFEGRCRVWIFDGVEAGRLGNEAANAFLKTLEEPPEHARFVLLAANPEAVLPTIRSRCQQLLLPGAVAVAQRLVESATPPELVASALVGEGLEEATREVRAALRAGRGGEARPLLRLPYVLPETVPPFATVAVIAIELAGETDDEEFALLATELLVIERRCRSLNLNVRGQLVSCLMRWYRGL
jgi:hypothetical protein